jgi:hypothetical protein
MAHFALIDENNFVLQVVVVSNNELIDEENVESEKKGINFLKSIFGENTNWVQTSYNGKIRANYAGIGFSYDAENNVFIAPKPYDSWVLNKQTFTWEPPIQKPEFPAAWNEQSLSWVEIVTSDETTKV